jgi:hypothetical protein
MESLLKRNTFKVVPIKIGFWPYLQIFYKGGKAFDGQTL